MSVDATPASTFDARGALSAPRVFISYARSDGEAGATALRGRLQREQPSITLWQDRVDLEGGVGWWRQIAEALDQVQYLVLLVTPGAIASPWAQKEWLLAREKGVCVFPVKAMPDETTAFASLPRWMRKAHFYDVDREWDSFVSHLKAPCRARRVPFMAPDLPRDFVDRPALLEGVMRAILERSGGSGGSGTGSQGLALSTALQGAGGLGKTTLAAAACHRAEVLSQFDDGILWVTLGREPNLVEALGKFYVALTGLRPGFVDVEDASLHVAQALVDRNCLLVIDDVWDRAHLRPFLRGAGGCFRLVTTRIFDLSVEIDRLDVDKMRPVEAASLLSARIAFASSHAAALRGLAQRLGDWPLLLELANATLRHRLARGDDIDGALDHLDRKLTKQGITAFDARNPVERQQAISRTLQLSLELLDAPTRERCLLLGLFPEDTEVPLEVVQCIWQADDLDTEDALQAIDNVALARFDMQTGCVRLHDVVRAYLESCAGDLALLHAQVADTLEGSDAPSVAAYRWRWLTHHLSSAGRQADLRQRLTSFDWIRRKIAATSLSELIGEYARFPSDPGFAAIQGGLRLASHVLLTDPGQLASQLLARIGTASPLVDAARLCADAAGWDQAHWLEPFEPLLTQPAGALVLTLAASGGPVTALALSPDADWLASGAAAGAVQLWNLASGVLATSVAAHAGPVTALAWCDDGAAFVSAGDDGLLARRDARTAECRAGIDIGGECCRAVAALAGGERVVSASAAGLKAWSMQTDRAAGGPPCEEQTGSAGVDFLAACAGGAVLLGATADGQLAAWQSSTLAPLWSHAAHRGALRAFAVSADHRHALTAGADGWVIVWELALPASAAPRARRRWLSDQPGLLTAAALDASASRIALGFDDGVLLLFDLAAELHTRHEQAHGGAVTALLFDERRRALVSAGDDGLIRLWDARKAPGAELAGAHAAAVLALGASGDGSLVLSSADPHELVVWSVDSGAMLQRVEGPGPWLVTLPGGASFGVWCGQGNALSRFAGTLGVTRSRTGVRSLAAVEPDGVYLEIDVQRRLRAWSSVDARCLGRLDLASEAVVLFAWSPGRRAAACLDGDGVLRLQALADGGSRVIDTGLAEATALAISDDGSRVAVGFADGHAIAWTDRAGASPQRWRAHRSEVAALCFGQGARLLSVGVDKVATLWDADRGVAQAAYTAESALTSCAWVPGGAVFAVGDAGGLVHFLRARAARATTPGAST